MKETMPAIEQEQKQKEKVLSENEERELAIEKFKEKKLQQILQKIQTAEEK